jgi:hypothetical protein
MSKSLIIDFGGMVLRFIGTGPDFVLSDPYQPFITDAPAEVTLNVCHQAPDLSNLGTSLFSGSFWSFYELGERSCFQVHTRSRARFPRTDTLIFAPGSDQADLFVEQDLVAAYPALTGLDIPPYVLDKMMATAFITQRQGLHFHACGVNDQGRGFLFAGYSGAGKSTTARLWRDIPGATLLSDERVTIRWHAGQPWMYGTPWHSDAMGAGNPVSVPLERIFIIQHATQNQARQMKAPEAVSALAARSYLPFWDTKGVARALEFLDGLVQAVPCYELGFVPDDTVVGFVQCLNES